MPVGIDEMEYNATPYGAIFASNLSCLEMCSLFVGVSFISPPELVLTFGGRINGELPGCILSKMKGAYPTQDLNGNF